MRTYDKQKRDIFSKNLRFYLKKFNKTQKEVAESIGTLPGTFGAWARGEVLPRADKLTALAEYFRITEGDLLEDPQTISIENLDIDDLKDLHGFVEYLQYKKKKTPTVESLLDVVRNVPEGSENSFIASVAQLNERDIEEIQNLVNLLSTMPMNSQAIRNVSNLFKALRTVKATSKQEEEDD